jgi:hypothetical protein
MKKYVQCPYIDILKIENVYFGEVQHFQGQIYSCGGPGQ